MSLFEKTDLDILEDNFKKAQEWCKNTRDILKIKTSWYKKDVKGDEYETLKAMTKKVTKRLEKLKGNEAYKSLLQEFVDQTSLLKNAKGSNNKGLATSLLDKLTILDLKIDVAEKKRSPEDVEKGRTKVIEEGKVEFQKQLLTAQQSLEYLKSLEKTVGNQTYSFVGLVPDHIQKAEQLLSQQKLEDALLTLGKVQTAREEQELNHHAYLKFAKKLEDAVDLQSKFRCLEQTKVEPLKKVIVEASQLASQKKYVEAYKKLKEVDSAYSSVKSSLSGDDKKKLEEFAEKRSYFEKLYDNLLEQIQLLSASRAKEHESNSLDKASEKLVDINKKFEGALNADDIQLQITALNEVQKLVHEANQEKSSNKEKSNANLEAMSKYLEKRHKAEYALKSMDMLFGVDAEKQQLQQLMANAEKQLKKKGELVIGYVEALQDISGYKDIVKAATEKSLGFCTQELPSEVQEAVSEVGKRIDKLRDTAVLSTVEAAFFHESLQVLVAKVDEKTILPTKENKKSESEKAGLLNRVIEIGSRLDLRGQELQTAKNLATSKIDTYRQLIAKLKSDGIPDLLLADPRKLLASATMALEQCDFSAASFDTEVGTKLAEEVASHHEKNKKEWNGVQNKLTQYIEFANGIIGLPFFESHARELKNQCQEVIRVFESTGDYQKALTLFQSNEIEFYHQTLSATDALPPEEVKKWLAQATKDINSEIDKIWSNPKIAGYETTHPKWFKNIKLVIGGEIATQRNNWREFVQLTKPNAQQPQLDEKQISLKASEIKNQLGLIGQRWSESKNVEKLLKESSKVSVQPSAPQQENEPLKKEEELQRQRTEKVEKDLSKAKDQLKSIKERHKNFQGYQKKLEEELADIALMIESGDQDILDLAEKKLKLTLAKILEVHPKKREKNAVRFGDVETLWTELHKMLGEHNYVPIRLPETHQKLLDQLKAAEVLARKSPPEKGLQLLEPLREPIRLAREKAGKLNDDHERYKQERRDFENEIEEARKKTGSYYSDRVISLRDYVNSRLKEGETLRHTENGLPDAFKLLHELRKMIREVMSNPESQGGPEGKIRELDSKYYQEQLEIREMARQFEIKVNDFKGPYLKSIKKTIELNAQESGVGEADLKDMLRMVDSLASQADSAIQLVKPYIASVQHVPHKTIGQDPGPDKDKAMKDFKAAEAVLSEGRQTAERLTRSTATTNVLIAATRKDVEKFWIKQVNQFGSVIEETIKQIDSFKSDFDKDPITENCDAAKELLTKAKGQFSISAFSAPLKVLTDIPRPPVNERLAAREEALKTMRQYREALLHDPVLRMLTDKSNPLDQKKLLAAFGNIRVALKRIEIESLIGV